MAQGYANLKYGHGRRQSIAQSGDNDKVQTVINVSYSVEVTGVVNPADIDVIDVLDNSGFPIVNVSVWEDAAGTLVSPYLICRGADVRQDPNNAFFFTCESEWRAETRGPVQNIVPPATLDLLGTSEDSEIEMGQRVMYEDNAWEDPAAEDPRVRARKKIQTPAGNSFSEPLFERYPILHVRLAQYESFINYQTMLDRSYRVNRKTYRGQPRYSWLIGEVEASQVTVRLASGPVNAALVVYPLAYTPVDEGWRDKVALIDKEYFEPGSGKWISFQEKEHRTQRFGLVKADGQRKDPQTDPPDYAEFETFEDIDFDTFLQA